MTRISVLVLGFLLAASQAEAAYKGRVLVPAGPLFNTAPIVSGSGTDVQVRKDIDINALQSHLVAPGGVSVAKVGDTEHIYVADVFTVRDVNAATGAIRNVTPLSTGDFYPTTVTAATIDAHNLLIVGSWISGRVQFIDAASGQLVREEKDLAQPYDIAALPDGRIAVAEAGGGRVLVIAADGTRDVLAEGLQRPMGLALTSEGTLYVTDRTAGTLIALNIQSKERRIVGTNLNAPEGIVVLPDGNVAVMETARRAITGIDPKTGARSNIATNLAVGDQTETMFTPKLGQPADPRIFNGIALGADGTLYLPSDVQTVLYMLKTGGGPASFMAMIRSLTSVVFR